MDLITSAGSKLYISDETTDQTTVTGYAALTWTEIENVEDLGDIGDEREIITFTSLGDGRVRKTKGAADAGTQTVVCGLDPTSSASGQRELDTAAGESTGRNFYVERDDALTASGHGTRYYYKAKVSSNRLNLGQQNNVQRATYMLAIDSSLTQDDAT